MEGSENGIRVSGREALYLSGVTEVRSYDEEEVQLTTGDGRLLIRGGGLRMERLEPEKGLVTLRGRVDSLEYLTDPGPGGGLLARIFR